MVVAQEGSLRGKLDFTRNKIRDPKTPTNNITFESDRTDIGGILFSPRKGYVIEYTTGDVGTLKVTCLLL